MHVVFAADEFVAMPLAAAASSVVRHRTASEPLIVHVIDGGITDRSRRRVERSIRGNGVRLSWHEPPAATLRELAAASGSSYPPIAFARLLLPELLPSVERVVYLDVDLVVRRDLTELHDLDLEGALCAAACDADGNGQIGSVTRFDAASMGAPPSAPYVNTGVMVIDLDAWRLHGLTARATALLAAFPGSFGLADQDVLNVVLAGHIGVLDPRWNVYTALYGSPCQLDDELHRAAVADPWILHFTQRPKPWQRGCVHPMRHVFLEALDHTAWAGWRPTPVRSAFDTARRGWRKAKVVSAWRAGSIGRRHPR